MPAINTFSKGLNQDTSKTLYSPDSYYNAKNLKFITQTGLSTGSLETIKGTKLDFIVPNIPQTTYEVGSETGPIVVPAQIQPKIIGSCATEKYLIIFTTTFTATQIWQLQYNEANDTIIGLIGGFLVVGTHLKYNRFLDCSENNRIHAIARFETDKFFRIYWVDGGRNNLRSINLNNPNTLNIPYRTIDVLSNTNFTVPVLEEVLIGNLPIGRISYFYRLITRDGAISCYSSLSQMIDLVPGNPEGNSWEYPEVANDFRLEEDNKEAKERIQFSSEKAIKIRIPHLDKDYDYVQIGYVLWELSGQTQAFLFPEVPYENNTTDYLFIHDGNEQHEFPITNQELNSLLNVFEKPKEFIAKNNWLFPTNTKASDYTVNFDARSYSYKFGVTSGTDLKDHNGVITFYTNAQLANLPINADAINPDPLIYKYKADGMTLGGEGPNVKYSFIIQDLLVDNNIGTPSNLDTHTAAPFFKAGKFTTPSFTPVIGGESYNNLNKSFSDLTSPYLSSILVSHARGENYRYGFSFKKTNGQKSYVQWNADISIPLSSETGYELSHVIGGFNYVKSIGILFEIKLTQQLINENEEVVIVRVERKEEDRTKLGTGITGSFCKHKHEFFDKSDITAFLADVLFHAIKGTIQKSAGGLFGSTIFTFFATTFNISFEQQIKDVITDTLNAIPSSAGSNQMLSLSSTEDEFIQRVFNSLSQVGIGSGSIFAGVFTTVTHQLLTTAMARTGDGFLRDVFESFKRELQGLDTVVYGLDNGYTAITSGSGLPAEPYSAIAGRNYGYIISPISQFQKYIYKTGDKLRIIATCEDRNAAGLNGNLVQIYHRGTRAGILNRAHSTAAVRKWLPNYNKSVKSQIDNINTIITQKSLDPGEVLKGTAFSGLPTDGSFVNSFLGFEERYAPNGSMFGNITQLSIKAKVQGIGDRKQLIVTDMPFPGITSVSGPHYVLDQQHMTNNVADGLVTSPIQGPSPATTFGSGGDTELTLKLARPRVLDGPGNYLVSYERALQKQYGGNFYTERQLNTYHEVFTTPVKTFTANISNFIQCYNGDTYVGMYGAVNYGYYFDTFSGYTKAGKTKKSMGECFPAEAPFNFNLREGTHFNESATTSDLDITEGRFRRINRRVRRQSKKLGISPDTATELIKPKRFIFDSFIYNDVWNQQKTVSIYSPKPIIDIFTKNSFNRTWKSRTKIDGELFDSWRQFPPKDYLDVEGQYGPINNISIIENSLIFFQTNAVGIIITNEQAAVTSNRGDLLQLASANPLSSYKYITTESGCSHRFGVVPTNLSLYYVDALRKKILMFTPGRAYQVDNVEPLTDIKGLSAYFKQILQGNIVNQDDTLNSIQPNGIHGVYDSINNVVYFTFLNTGLIGPPITKSTISYNLLSETFESFYDFTPGLYIHTPNRILSPDENNPFQGHQHNKGDYGRFYGIFRDSMIQILTNIEPNKIKTWNNYELFTEVIDNLGVQLNETVDHLDCINDNQTTGTITLINYPSVGYNIRRRERKWHTQVPRDANPAAFTTLKARMRDFYILSRFSFTNNANKRFILHEIYTYAQESIT